MNYLRTDQYTRVMPDCPMNVELHPADDVVEIVLGEQRFSGSSLRLQIDDPDTCARLMQCLADARAQLVRHREMSLASDLTTPLADVHVV
jgi:hypothetical protein